MSTLASSNYRFVSISCLVFAVVASVVTAQAADSKRKNPTSKIYVADIDGESSINTGEKIEDLTKKSVHSAEGTVVETKPGAKSAFVLSNGTGLAFDADTRLEIKKFIQEPFTPNRTDLNVEPSISQTSAFLPKGGVGICSGKMVAGSSMNYSTRHADVGIRARKVTIETTDNETTVSLIDGEATIRGNKGSGGESLKPGQQAVITRASNFDPPTIVIRPIPPEDVKRIEAKVAIACMARQTVYFETAKRANQNSLDDVFSQDDSAGEDVIVPVEILPGTLTPPNVISPYKIP